METSENTSGCQDWEAEGEQRQLRAGQLLSVTLCRVLT